MKKGLSISIAGTVIIIIVMIGAIFPSPMHSVYAQDLSTETPTPVSILYRNSNPANNRNWNNSSGFTY